MRSAVIVCDRQTIGVYSNDFAGSYKRDDGALVRASCVFGIKAMEGKGERASDRIRIKGKEKGRGA